MNADQLTLLAILAFTIALFIWGRWRHDMVALAALLASVAAGLVPGADAFRGFGHPAVITVAGILVLSHGLQTSGAIDALSRRLLPTSARPAAMIGGLTAIAALLSGFMNNVGALALLMPLAIRAADRLELPPGRMLMPLAFGSILGGMTTLIGTPPNLIVSAYRRQAEVAPYAMFDFAPVGVAVALTGVAFIALGGWRLVPVRKRSGVEGFESGNYVTEAVVPEGAKIDGSTIREIEEAAGDAQIQILSLVRREVRLRTPRPDLRVRAHDVLLLETDPSSLTDTLALLGLELPRPAGTDRGEENAKGENGEAKEKNGKAAAAEHAEAVTGEHQTPEDEETDEAPPPRASDDDAKLIELVVGPNAPLIGQTARGIELGLRYQISLLAISRQGRRSVGRLRRTAIQPGDVLLMHGHEEAVAAFAAEYGCLPLAGRALRLHDKRQMWLAGGIMIGAIALATTGLASAAVAFMAGVLAVMVTRVVPPARVYDAIDWSVIVLLACLLPVADALLTTGTAGVIADFLVQNVAHGLPLAALVLILVLTMTLSDVMNNAATVAVMAPVAHGAALALGADPDAFFMAVAVGGSCAFLTPIGHQNNTLILGPGGFRFGDYWRLGIALELIVLAVGVPVIVMVWGL